MLSLALPISSEGNCTPAHLFLRQSPFVSLCHNFQVSIPMYFLRWLFRQKDQSLLTPHHRTNLRLPAVTRTASPVGLSRCHPPAAAGRGNPRAGADESSPRQQQASTQQRSRHQQWHIATLQELFVRYPPSLLSIVPFAFKQTFPLLLLFILPAHQVFGTGGLFLIGFLYSLKLDELYRNRENETEGEVIKRHVRDENSTSLTTFHPSPTWEKTGDQETPPNILRRFENLSLLLGPL